MNKNMNKNTILWTIYIIILVALASYFVVGLVEIFIYPYDDHLQLSLATTLFGLWVIMGVYIHNRIMIYRGNMMRDNFYLI